MLLRALFQELTIIILHICPHVLFFLAVSKGAVPKVVTLLFLQNLVTNLPGENFLTSKEHHSAAQTFRTYHGRHQQATL